VALPGEFVAVDPAVVIRERRLALRLRSTTTSRAGGVGNAEPGQTRRAASTICSTARASACQTPAAKSDAHRDRAMPIVSAMLRMPSSDRRRRCVLASVCSGKNFHPRAERSEPVGSLKPIWPLRRGEKMEIDPAGGLDFFFS